MHHPSRRTALKTGLTAFAAAGALTEDMFAAPKSSGETRALFLVGDYWHNGVAQETHWRRILEPAGWRLLFAQSSQFVTPAALKQADLFVVARYAGPDSLGFVPEGVIEKRPAGAPFMTDEQEDAIVANVRRGMGLLSMHCSTWNPERKKYMELVGIAKPLMHGPVQHVKIHDINQDHPISRGLKDFDIPLDENFGAELADNGVTLLYKSTGQQDKRTDNAAWCREEEKGRVVALLFGHEPQPFQVTEVKYLMWRSAHWAMRRDIPPAEYKAGY
ncbi:MAG: ThuA domain-containing protein [Candidatus Latescibacter sp.]|nr:ThuA domain-containing protein [Candidatus Latescibacter sp.]